jgi:hypothetical protein
MIKGPDTVVVIILYWTYGQSQNVVQSLLKHIPEAKVLAIDNNPCLHSAKRLKSYLNCKYWGNKGHRWNRIWIKHFCHAESDWFKNHESVLYCKTTRWLHHGEAINYALEWCLKNHIIKMIHIEPDCIVSGRQWYDNLLQAYDAGNWWMVSGVRSNFKILYPTPCVLNVKKAQVLDWGVFQIDKNDEILKEPNLCDHINIQRVFDHGYWDTSNRATLQCSLAGKAKYVDAPDFVHMYNSSDKISRKAISFL